MIGKVLRVSKKIHRRQKTRFKHQDAILENNAAKCDIVKTMKSNAKILRMNAAPVSSVPRRPFQCHFKSDTFIYRRLDTDGQRSPAVLRAVLSALSVRVVNLDPVRIMHPGPGTPPSPLSPNLTPRRRRSSSQRQPLSGRRLQTPP